MRPFLNIAGYRFGPLVDLKDRQASVESLCRSHGLKGSILLSPEGLSVCVTGETNAVERLLATLRSWPGFADFQPHTGGTDRVPFRRLSVRVRQELIACGEAVDVRQHAAPAIEPETLKQLLDQHRAPALIDVRNQNEFAAGSFESATAVSIAVFHEFTAAARQWPPTLATQDVVVFCTNGLRSEKTAAWLHRQGFDHVRWLRGGLLGYLENCGDAHVRGRCRVTDPHLGAHTQWRRSASLQCERCRTPLSVADQERAHEHGGHCPYCIRVAPAQMAATLALRQQQLARLVEPLPGRAPHDHVRAVGIPAACDGLRLVDALRQIVVHAPERFWLDRCAQGLLRDELDRPCTPDRVVRAGERYLHRFPAVIEPDVNMQIEWLHEDASLVVVNKPAPLPMHAGGRYQRNTLKYVMDRLYAPQALRPAHRLDANTTGVTILARTQHAARKVQMQFGSSAVEKRYLVRVQGHPSADEFVCDAPISQQAGEAGSRYVDPIAGLPSRTQFRVLCRDDDGTALLEAWPRTGRTNQIRVHAWHLGWPVCNDPVYRSDGRLGDYQTSPLDAPPLCLHAWQISISHPVHGEPMTFAATPPAWLRPSRD
jgi:RluA family pseudouridine synthase